MGRKGHIFAYTSKCVCGFHSINAHLSQHRLQEATAKPCIYCASSTGPCRVSPACGTINLAQGRSFVHRWYPCWAVGTISEEFSPFAHNALLLRRVLEVGPDEELAPFGQAREVQIALNHLLWYKI